MKKAVLVIGLLLVAIPVSAQEVHVCWADQTVVLGIPRSVTRCRVAGEIVDYATEFDVPLRLFPDVGSASNGTCWFWRSVWTGWEIITRLGDGSANLGFDSDGAPGGPLNLDVTYPVCVSEPTDTDPAELLAWDLVEDYVHQAPGPNLNPRVPWGLTGAETHLGLAPPPPFADSIVDPTGAALEVEGSVAVVAIVWGDGASLSLPPEAFPQLTGYPNGIARHIYEVKTCDPPGSTPRCHPSLSSYSLEIRYQWFVHWRVDGGPWIPLTVPDTITSVAYPVREVISVLDTRE